MSYLWPNGLPITVEADADRIPHTFFWQNQPHPVDHIAKRWRIDEAWWQGRVWRDYFKLTTTTGLLVVLYVDWLSGAWYLQMLYD